MPISEFTYSWISSFSEDAFSATAASALQKTTGNTYWTKLDSEIATCNTQFADYGIARDIAVNGGKEEIAVRNAKRETFGVSLKALLANISAIAKGDEVMLVSTGFPMRSTNRTPYGPRPAPDAPVCTQGENSGTIKAATKTVPGGYLYTGRIALASKPDVFIQTVQQTGVRFEFAGLTPGDVYMVQMNCIGAAGPSNWSDFGTLRVI